MNQSERPPFSLLEALKKALPISQALKATKETIESLENNKQAFTASNNYELALNSIIKDSNINLTSERVFDHRIIVLPLEICKAIKEDNLKSEASNYQMPQDKITKVPTTPNSINRTTLQLDGKDPRNEVKFVSGVGPLEETTACLQMLAQIMELPFRSDSIKRSISETLGRDKQPSLPMIGQMVSTMGLRVTGAIVKPSVCTRMNMPCIIRWADGFSLAVSSNANGLLLAHPRLGWLELDPEQILEKCADGIEVLFVDRTNSTPNQKFTFGWFLPALRRYRSTLLLVLGSSFIVQLFTLANPLLIQVIIDKVISQRSLDTLQVLGIALVAVTILEGLLTSLRTFMFTDTTNRIDIDLVQRLLITFTIANWLLRSASCGGT